MNDEYYNMFLKAISRQSSQYGKLKLTSAENRELIDTITKSSPESDVYRIAAFLHYGQMTGGEEFIRQFQPDVKWKNTVLERMVSKLYSNDSQSNSPFESDYESKWRYETYQEMTTLIKGFDTYVTYNPQTLLFETERYLPEKAIFLLDAIALLDPNRFISICSEKNNPLWTLRWVKRIDGQSRNPLTVATFEKFPEAHKGIMLAVLWEDTLQQDADIFQAKIFELFSFLEQLNLGTSLPIVARILSRITNHRYSSLNSEQKNKMYEIKLDSILETTANWFTKITDLTPEQISLFVNCFYNPLNREVIWSCLELMKRVKKKGDSDIVRLVEKEVMTQYPSYWLTKGHNRNYSFNDTLTLKLVEILAPVWLGYYKDQAFEQLDQIQDIPTVDDLQKLLDKSDYKQLFEARERLLVHAYLGIQIMKNGIHSNREQVQQAWEGFFNFFFRFSKLESDIGANLSQAVKRAILKMMGSFFNQFGFPAKYKEWVTWLTDPEDITALIEGENPPQKEELLAIIKNRIPLYLAILRSNKLLDLAYQLYKLEEFQLATVILTQIDIKKMKPDLQAYWKRLTSTAFLNTAFSHNDGKRQIEYLRKAYEYSQWQIRGHFDRYEKENRLVSVQILGWLFDRGEISSAELANGYNLISLRDLKYLDNRPEDYYVNALLLVRILSTGIEPQSFFQEQMDMAMDKMNDIPGHELTQALLKSWYLAVKGNELMEEDIQMMIKHKEDIHSSKEWLPLPLQVFFEEMTNATD